MQPKTSQSLIPEDVYNLFVSPLVERKQRMSLLVNWFQRNYYRWQDIPTGTQITAIPITNVQFANALTEALSSYQIEIQTQRVWTWVVERNLPRPDNLRVMLEIAEEGSWQREFARIALEILASEEPGDSE